MPRLAGAQGEGWTMPTWAVVAVTIVISLVSAGGFLMLRCRGTGNPFGRRARWWAVAIIMITAGVSTGVALVVIAAGAHVIAACVGLVLPSGLWLGRAARDYGGRVPYGLVALATFPLRGLDDRMGDDMQEWCDDRARAAAKKPQWLADAAGYYFNQVGDGLADARVRGQLAGWQDSIQHKIRIVRLIELDPYPDRVEEALHYLPVTTNGRRYAVDDLPALSRRLTAEAENELNLFLACVYRLGYHRLLIYPFRPEPAPRVRPAPGGRPARREP
jgi:hypothetical protein